MREVQVKDEYKLINVLKFQLLDVAGNGVQGT